MTNPPSWSADPGALRRSPARANPLEPPPPPPSSSAAAAPNASVAPQHAKNRIVSIAPRLATPRNGPTPAPTAAYAAETKTYAAKNAARTGVRRTIAQAAHASSPAPAPGMIFRTSLEKRRDGEDDAHAQDAPDDALRPDPAKRPSRVRPDAAARARLLVKKRVPREETRLERELQSLRELRRREERDADEPRGARVRKPLVIVGGGGT